MATLYVITSCALLTWFRWAQDLQGRSYPFVGISCLYGIWLLASGATVPLDGITVSCLSFALWLLVSLIWAEKRYAVLELFVWFSYLLLFLAARSIPLELMMWILAPNAVILSALQLYRQMMIDNSDDTRKYFPVFGNSNHNSNFLLVGFFAALWLALNTVHAMWLFVLLISLAITRSRCRGAIVAMVVSMVAFSFSIQTEMVFYVTGLIILLSITYRKWSNQIANGAKSVTERIEIYGDALKRIHPRYLMGRGLNYFRVDNNYGRVHNDHLETIGEVGIIGYLLFANIFIQMSLEPIMLSAALAFWISAMFFYPFREVHTAAPFWGMMGAASGTGVAVSLFSVKVVGVLAILAIIIFVFTVFCNLADWRQLKKAQG